jgi:hypothetical protein
MTASMLLLDTWAASWPERITLRDAADEIGFDLFDGDDEDLHLAKTWIKVTDVVAYSVAELEANDADDRFGPLEAGLLAGGHNVPPVVVLPVEGMRDGHHRALLAQAAGYDRIPAYVPARATDMPRPAAMY